MPKKKPEDTLWFQWKHIADQNGVSKTLFENRIYGYKPKWDYLKAARTPPKRTGRKYKKGNEPIPKKYFERAKKIGLSINGLKYRVWTCGMDLELAVTIPPKYNRKPKVKEKERIKERNIEENKEKQFTTCPYCCIIELREGTSQKISRPEGPKERVTWKRK